MLHPLDRPIRAALTTRHRNLAEGGPRALRYLPDISCFAAAVDDSDESLEQLGSLIEPGGSMIVVGAGGHPVPPGTVADRVAAAVQMVAASVTAPAREFAFLELGDDDAADMLELATLTRPGPFAMRTHRFGGYIGIRHESRLVAMAGQRMQAPGFTEVSAVCTHPDHRGQGYGSFLLQVVAARIRERGESAFLHAYASNVNAIRLYEALGFRRRADMTVVVLRRA